MAVLYDRMIVILKGVSKTVQQNTVFTRWNLGFPATARVILVSLLRLNMRSTEKKTLWERLPNDDRFESLRMLRYRSWRRSIPLRNVLRKRKQRS